LCIDTCPTGAISENYQFKPGPLKLETAKTICNYCSIGCELEVHHRKGYVMKVTPADGLVNQEKLCKSGKFGYQYLNNPNRILKPLLKVDGQWKSISFDEAFEIIKEKISAVKPDENMFFAGARLSNEELYMVQKLARAGAKTHHVASLSYMGRGAGYHMNNVANAKFDELKDASKIYYVGSELPKNTAGHFINNAHAIQEVPVQLVSKEAKGVDVVERLLVKSYYHFVKAINYYLLANNKQNQLFIDDRTSAFEAYKVELLNEDYADLVEQSGICCVDSLEQFADEYNNQMNAILMFSENELSANTSFEIYNLALITGKLGKTANGIIVLKDRVNSHGVTDMGICPRFGVGHQDWTNDDFASKIKDVWNLSKLPDLPKVKPYQTLQEGKFKNIFIFGEDPVGCALDNRKTDAWFDVDFLMVQDAFMTETAQKADLILPASFGLENEGTYTNTQKIIQKFEKGLNSKIEQTNLQQLINLNKQLGQSNLETTEDVTSEIISLLPVDTESETYYFEPTDGDNTHKDFAYGVDSITKMWVEEFKKQFE